MAQCEKRASAGTIVQKSGCSTTGLPVASLKHGASARFQLQKQAYECIVRKMKYFEKNQKMIDKRFLVVYD